MTSPLTTFHCSFINQKQFHAAVCLYNIRSQKMSNCDKNISDAPGSLPCATSVFLPHFDVHKY